MTVSAVVVSHGHARELETSLPALAPQVDELVVIANLPGSVGALPAGARVLESPRPRTFAANVNAGVAATTGEYVLVSNPDAVPEPGAVAALVRFADDTREPASSGRSSSGRTGRGNRRFAASRACWARSGDERRSGSCVVPTTTRRLTTARARPSRCRATGCSAAPAC